MKKVTKYILVLALAVCTVLTAVACKDKTKEPGVPSTGTGLTPAGITKLADLPDYGSKASSWNAAVVNYNTADVDYVQKLANLKDRIIDKQAEVTDKKLKGDKVSTPVNIFSKTEGEEIIKQMSVAGLSQEKMLRVVDYLAGDKDKDVDDAKVDNIVDKWQVGTVSYSDTDGWSFFDDYKLYEKLQEKQDKGNLVGKEQEKAEDNVKHQYRNMCRKVFDIVALDGDEFARMAFFELGYAIEIIEKEQNSGAIGTPAFIAYAKSEYDYETLTYLLAFDDVKTASEGQRNIVRLYGYYYNYARTQYKAIDDPTFNKQLAYSHKEEFTDAEWLDYVKIQRDMYVSSYRYSDNFYTKMFLPQHYKFQGYLMTREKDIFDYSLLGGKTPVDISNSQGLKYLSAQLNMTDWQWCYAGNETAMKDYNKAKSAYNSGVGSQDAKDTAEFEFKNENLKISDYLLTKMTKANLDGTMKYQIYSYGANVLTQRQSQLKEKKLLVDEKEAPEFYLYYVIQNTLKLSGKSSTPVTLNDMKEYAVNKIDAIVSQIEKFYIGNIDDKASTVSNTSWTNIHNEVKTAMDPAQYEGKNAKAKLKAQENLIIKKTYTLKPEYEGTTVPVEPGDNMYYNSSFDPNHNISQFANNYQKILMYSSGQSKISFMMPANQYYMIKGTPDVTYYPGYMGNLTETRIPGDKKLPEMLSYSDTAVISYNSKRELTFATAQKFDDGFYNKNNIEQDLHKDYVEVYNTAKAYTEVKILEKGKAGGTIADANYKYNYKFVAWYIDTYLQYRIETGDLAFETDANGDYARKGAQNTYGKYTDLDSYVLATAQTVASKKLTILDRIVNEMELFAGYSLSKTATAGFGTDSFITINSRG